METCAMVMSDCLLVELSVVVTTKKHNFKVKRLFGPIFNRKRVITELVSLPGDLLI